MTGAERLAERTPERIWLIDMGDCIAWCDDPDPSGTGEDDAVEYVRATLIRSQAEELERLRRALGAVTKTANLLYANAVGCATNHYGDDIHEHGLPGWLADCAKDIQAARAALGER